MIEADLREQLEGVGLPAARAQLESFGQSIFAARGHQVREWIAEQEYLELKSLEDKRATEFERSIKAAEESAAMAGRAAKASERSARWTMIAAFISLAIAILAVVMTYMRGE